MVPRGVGDNVKIFSSMDGRPLHRLVPRQRRDG
jgi:hypothetical protein